MNMKALQKLCEQSNGQKEFVQAFMEENNISCDEMKAYCEEFKTQSCCDEDISCEDMLKSYGNNQSCCDEQETDCCATNTSDCGCGETNVSDKACSSCKEHGIKVSAVTLKAQLKKEHYEKIHRSADDFHFCTNPECDTVYYSSDGKEVYGQDDIKSKVSCKNEDLKTPLCYCKKLLKKDVLQMIEENQKNIPSKIKAIISEGKTFCEKSNPRGTCCTQDIATFLDKYDINWKEQEQAEKESFSCTC